jgi:anti-anti-sigma regulatory factor
LEGRLKDEGNPGKSWNISIEWQRLAARTTVVHVAGDLRGDGAASLRRTLAGELTGTPELLVLDLSDIEQIDVDGIDALDAIAELAAMDDIRFCLVFPPKGVERRRLNLVELSKRFETFSSVDEVLQPPMSGRTAFKRPHPFLDTKHPQEQLDTEIGPSTTPTHRLKAHNRNHEHPRGPWVEQGLV